MSSLAAAALVPFLAVAGPRPGTADLVDVARLVPDATVDLRYATARNVAGRPMYPAAARCLLIRPVAERLARAAARLRAEGFTLRLWDCYRPAAAQRELWRIRPTPGLVADPRTGSNHQRGAAIDVALAGPGGADVELPTDFDAFGPRARSAATGGVSPAARRHRELLRAALVAEGFRPIRLEWWHFDAPEARGAPILEAALAP